MPSLPPRLRARFAGAATLTCLATAPWDVRAADTAKASGSDENQIGESGRQRAEARYRQGATAYREGRYKDAIDAFLEADALSPSAALSYNAALAYDRLLDTAGALRFYRDFLRRAQGNPEAPRVTVRVLELERRLASRGVQQVSVLSEPAGATVAIDGRALGVTPWTVELTPGRHHVSLSLKSHEEESRDFELPLDHAVDVDVTLRPSAALGSPAEPGAEGAPTEPTRQHGLGAWPWVTLGMGGAALLTAGAFELSRRAAEREARAEPTQRGYAERLDTMESRQTSARWLGAAGGALLLTSGVLFVLDAQGRRETRSATLTVEPGHYFLSYRSAF